MSDNVSQAAGAPLTGATVTGAGSPSTGANAAGGLTREALGALLANVSVNPALVEFPQDPWGFTRGLRAAILKAASSVKGQQDKQDVLYGTLAVGMKHIQNRLKLDKAGREADLATSEEAIQTAEKYARQYAKPVNPEDAVRDAMRVVTQAREAGMYKDIVGA